MGYTLYRKELTPALKDIILEFVLENNSNPTGVWRDFHCVHRSWRNLKNFTQVGLLAEDELPTEPDATAYPDVEGAATLQCPETCCKNCNLVYGCACINCSGQTTDFSTVNETTSYSDFSELGWQLLSDFDWSEFGP